MTSAEQPSSQYYKLVKNNEYISGVEYFIKDENDSYKSIGNFSGIGTKEIIGANQYQTYLKKTYSFGTSSFTESETNKIYVNVPKNVLSKITLLKDGTEPVDITDNLTDVYEVVVTFGNNFFKKYNVHYDEITMGFSESDTDTTYSGVESVDDLKLNFESEKTQFLKSEFLKKNGKEYESIGIFVKYVPSKDVGGYGNQFTIPSKYTFLKDGTTSTFENSNDIYVLISEIKNIKLKKTDSPEVDITSDLSKLDKVVVELGNDEKRELNVQTSYGFFSVKKQKMDEKKLTKKKEEEKEIENAKILLNTFPERFMQTSNIRPEELQSITTEPKPTTECTMKDNITQFHTLVNELKQKLENRKKKFVSRNLNALTKMFKSETDYDKLTSYIGTLKKTYDELITKFDTEIEYKLFDFFYSYKNAKLSKNLNDFQRENIRSLVKSIIKSGDAFDFDVFLYTYFYPDEFRNEENKQQITTNQKIYIDSHSLIKCVIDALNEMSKLSGILTYIQRDKIKLEIKSLMISSGIKGGKRTQKRSLRVSRKKTNFKHKNKKNSKTARLYKKR
jgi:hypothetical protein